jgi:hypothetical protein
MTIPSSSDQLAQLRDQHRWQHRLGDARHGSVRRGKQSIIVRVGRGEEHRDAPFAQLLRQRKNEFAVQIDVQHRGVGPLALDERLTFGHARCGTEHFGAAILQQHLHVEGDDEIVLDQQDFQAAQYVAVARTDNVRRAVLARRREEARRQMPPIAALNPAA